MKNMFLAAIAAVILGLGATTMAHAVTPGNSPWANQTSQDNGQG
jgi:hypothetical protein